MSIHLKKSSALWQTFCLGRDELNHQMLPKLNFTLPADALECNGARTSVGMMKTTELDMLSL